MKHKWFKRLTSCIMEISHRSWKPFIKHFLAQERGKICVVTSFKNKCAQEIDVEAESKSPTVGSVLWWAQSQPKYWTCYHI